MSILIDDALRRQLEVPAVNAYLIFSVLYLREDTAADIEKHWQKTAKEIDALRIRSCPGETLNLILGHLCLRRFGAAVLSRVPGFYSFSRNPVLCSCSEWRSDCVCSLRAWRLDLDPQLCRRGFLMPLRDSRGWLNQLLIFRHPRDSAPFVLRTRWEALAA